MQTGHSLLHGRHTDFHRGGAAWRDWARGPFGENEPTGRKPAPRYAEGIDRVSEEEYYLTSIQRPVLRDGGTLPRLPSNEGTEPLLLFLLGMLRASIDALSTVVEEITRRQGHPPEPVQIVEVSDRYNVVPLT